ncbi:18995_t:CDS:2 [Funneliformis geosporum]|uniref:Exosome complex protein n=1 Tax=Funneliformis geosporum TaxID=1117311 RepID=A0A9W4T050_9GLOM|nr:15365_t:CDS:2 [Funneliformis geosporum]CAI2185492.1 18995_t:CDS:2 [Funneliformis geosporum]
MTRKKHAKQARKSSATIDMEAQTDTLFTKIRNTLSELECGFDDIDRLLEPMLSQPLSELASGLGPIDRARLYLLYGFTLNSLISLFLELKGQDSKIKILEEQYKRIQDCSEKITNTVNPPQPSLSLNRNAASRFIKHALSNPDSDTREKATNSGTNTRFDDNEDHRGANNNSRSNSRHNFSRDDRNRDNRSRSSRHDRDYRPYDRRDRDRDRDVDGGDERKSFSTLSLRSPELYLM